MAVLTINQKLDQVNNFINSIKDSKNSYYFFVGKAEPWRDENGNVDETKVPEANNSVAQIEQNVYKDLVYGKLIDFSDVVSMVKRYNWANNTIYARYNNNDPDIYSKNFYVITDSNEVYKCIDNGRTPNYPNGVPSTVKPTITQTSGTFRTYDNYTWKYMFTCDPSKYNKFQTKDYIPVTPNNDVITYSVNGTIDSITLLNGGENYQVFETGFLNRFINSQVVELAYNSNPHDNHYKNSQIYLKAGFGGGQIRRITSSSGLNKTISVEPPFNYYENLKLKNPYGIFTIGDLVVQHIYNIKYIFDVGFLNVGDTVIQSDTGSSGTIITSNTSVMRIETDSEIEFNVDYPLIDTTSSPTQKNGLVDVIDDSNLALEFKGRLSYEITANSGWSKATAFTQEFNGFKTKFEDDFSVGAFVQVNNEIYKNVRRITRIADPNWFLRAVTANTDGANSTYDFIKISDANTYYRVNDYIQYIIPTNETGIKASYIDTNGVTRTNLVNNAFYYVSFTNTSGIAISTTYNGANIHITEDRDTPPFEHHQFKYTVVNRTVTANTLGANAGVLIDSGSGTNHIYSVSSANVFLMPRANTFFSVHDRVYYTVPTNSKPLGSLTGNTPYYISFVNSTSFALAANDSLQSGLSANISLEDRRLRLVKPINGHHDVNGNLLMEPNDVSYIAYDIGANTVGVNSTLNTINLLYANSYYEKNYKVKYTTKGNGTAISPLVNNSIYYISFVNSSAFALSTTYGGSNLNLEESRSTACTHNIQYIQDDPHTFTVFPYMFVNAPFENRLDNKKIYSIPTALSIDSYNTSSSLGSIVYVNLNSAEINFADIHPVDQSFLLGESLVVVDNANNNLYTNGTVSFTNNFTVILSDVQGSNFIPVKEQYKPSYLYGLTSKIKARIVSLNTSPNITVETQEGGFSPGGTIFVTTADGVPTANAKIINKYSSPNDITEYVIGPRVNIDGDGNGAVAFCTVDLSSKNPTRKITAIELINHGQNYTRANVSVTSNTLYGIGASFEATVSPVRGHGFDAYSELGAFYSGISKKFDTAINELFYLPTYGSYRKIGIIKNPFINDVIFEVDNFDRVTLKYDKWNSTYFEDGEILVQHYCDPDGLNFGANAAGIIVSSNSTTIELKNVKGTFLEDPDTLSNNYTAIYGWTSGANAHVTNTQIKYFNLSSDLESVSEEIPGGTGKINQVFLDTGEVILYRNIIANTYSSKNPSGVDTARIVDAAEVDSVNDIIPLENANVYFTVNDKVFYYTPAVSDGAIGGLSNNTFYYISFANSSSFALSETYGGANIALSVTYSADAEYHNFRYVDSGKITKDHNFDVIKIDLANTIYEVGKSITYIVPEDGDAIGGLVHNQEYYIAYVNSSSFALSDEPNGEVIPINESKITKPSTFTLYANTDGVDATNDIIYLEDVSAKLAKYDKIYYSYPENNTAIEGLLNYTYYYISYLDPSVSHPIVANTAFIEPSGYANKIKLSGASTKFSVGDKVLYTVSQPGIAITPLVDGTYYYISYVSGDWFSLAETKGGSTINISESRTDNPGEEHHISTLAKFALSTTKYGANLDLKEIRTDNPGEEHSIFITPQVHQFRYNVTNLNAKNTKIRVTDAVGNFAVGDHIYEPRTDAHAQITKILTSNGAKDSSIGFGNKFNQTARITLSANDHPYVKYEYVYQSDTYATGQIISTNDELDIEYIDESNFIVGEKIINQQTHATAIIASVNTASRTIKLSSVTTEGFDDFTNKAFNPSNIIKNSTETKTTTINKVYSVLVLADVDHINNNETTPYLGKFRTGNNIIWGYTSKSKGETVLPDSIVYPDLVKYSGKVIYTDNISKFDKDPSSNEQLKLIIKF